MPHMLDKYSTNAHTPIYNEDIASVHKVKLDNISTPCNLS